MCYTSSSATMFEVSDDSTNDSCQIFSTFFISSYYEFPHTATRTGEYKLNKTRWYPHVRRTGWEKLCKT